jgi:hypothetical protein
MVLPSRVTGNDGRTSYGLKPEPLKAHKVFCDSVNGGEPIAFQQEKDITHVEAPSSITVPTNALVGDHNLYLKRKLWG